MWQLIDPTNPNIGYTEYWGGTAVYRTTNGFYDLTEISVNVPGDPQGQWVTPFVLNPKIQKHLSSDITKFLQAITVEIVLLHSARI